MDDYKELLKEFGLTQEDMDRAAETLPTPLQEPGRPYYLAPSDIQGMGVYASRDVRGMIGKMKVGDEWYEVGRYVNHAKYPNAVAVKSENTLFCYGEVKEGEEITLDYRQVRRILEH